jgi:hypothetical protein
LKPEPEDVAKIQKKLVNGLDPPTKAARQKPPAKNARAASQSSSGTAATPIR